MADINRELIANLYGGQNPFSTAQLRHGDRNYPHTNIVPALIDYLLLDVRPSFVLELGSFVGNSAVVIASSIKRTESEAGLVCCDPFCGDVNMWLWEKEAPVAGCDGQPYRFLGLENGIVSIYPRFLANVFFSGHSDVVTPIQATSLVGLKLIQRLFDEKRISHRPSVIFLDSAHEANETFLELDACWKMLPSKGVLFGDDWDWPAVRTDVLRLASRIGVDESALQRAHAAFLGSQIYRNVLLLQKQWVLFKGPAE